MTLKYFECNETLDGRTDTISDRYEISVDQ